MPDFSRVDDWDCIIIGGGIVGCATAHFLSRAGMRCLIVEGGGIACAQSGRNLGFVRQQGRDFRELALSIEANAIWRTLEADLGRSVGWVQRGILTVASDEKAAAELGRWTERSVGFKLETKMLTAREVHALAPGLRGEVFAGMYTASDGTAEPVLATRAFFDSARSGGADASIGRSVDEIVTAGGTVCGVRIGDRLLKSRIVVCAAGTGTSALLRGIGLLFPQDHIRVTVLRTERTTRKFDVGITVQGIALRQSPDGSIHISNMGGEYDVRMDSLRYARWFTSLLRKKGDLVSIIVLGLLGSVGDARSVQVTDMPAPRNHPKPSRRYAAKARSRLTAVFPDLAELKILSEWAGRIEYTPDMIPAVGSTKRVRGLLIASGFSGHGFGIGPAAGKALAIMATGASASASLAELSPDRFADGTWRAVEGAY